jgi:hypothetical protein
VKSDSGKRDHERENFCADAFVISIWIERAARRAANFSASPAGNQSLTMLARR